MQNCRIWKNDRYFIIKLRNECKIKYANLVCLVCSELIIIIESMSIMLYRVIRTFRHFYGSSIAIGVWTCERTTKTPYLLVHWAWSIRPNDCVFMVSQINSSTCWHKVAWRTCFLTFPTSVGLVTLTLGSSISTDTEAVPTGITLFTGLGKPPIQGDPVD